MTVPPTPSQKDPVLHASDAVPVPRSSIEIRDKPAWSPRQITAVCFLASFLPGGVLWALNWERLGKPEKVRRSLLGVLAGFAVFMTALFLLPDNRSIDR